MIIRLINHIFARIGADKPTNFQIECHLMTFLSTGIFMEYITQWNLEVYRQQNGEGTYL